MQGSEGNPVLTMTQHQPGCIGRWLGATRAGLVAGLLLLATMPAMATITAAKIETGTTLAPTGSTPVCALDGSLTNLTLCTNDVATYNIEYASNGGDSSLTIVSTLPTCTVATIGCPTNGIFAIWDALPLQCDGPGSGISADGLTLTCVRNGPVDPGTARILPQVRILGNTPNGTLLPSPITTVTTPEMGGVLFPAIPAGTVNVVAQPAYDLAKTLPSQGPLGITQHKGPDGITDGWLFSYSAAILVPDGGRGIEGLDASGISFQDVLANITVTGTNPDGIANAAVVEAGIRANAVLWQEPTELGGPNACVDNGFGPNTYTAGAPYGRLGPTTNRLQTSGTCVVSQAGGPGGTLSTQITNALWTNNVFPPLSAAGVSLPAGVNFVSAKLIFFWVPKSVFDPLPLDGSINISNTYTGVQGTSISGQPLVQPNTANDTAITAYTKRGAIGFMSKYWVDYDAVNSLRTSGDHTYDGIIIDGMPARGRVYIANMGFESFSGGISCDKIDNTKVQVFADSVVVNEGATPPAYVVEYGTGGIDGVGNSWASGADYATGTCADDQSPGWFTSRASVPGGDAAITKVRLRFLGPLLAASKIYIDTPVRMTATAQVAGMGVPAGHQWPIGTKVNNWGTITGDGLTFSGTTVVDSTGHQWVVPPAPYYAANGNVINGVGDSLNLAAGSATISKETVVPDNSATQVTGGQSITYILRPVLTAVVATPLLSTAIVRDVLPPGTTYIDGSASLAPDSVLQNTPSAGYTTLVWNYTSLQVGVPIAPITFDVTVDNTLPNGQYLPNFTVISSPVDPRQCQASGGSYDGILNNGYTVAADGNVTGTLCVHAARRDLRVSNPGGFQINKRIDTPEVEPGQPIQYTLRWISVGAQLDSSDLIDVLPYNGDGRGTNRVGSMALIGPVGPITGDGTPASTVYYTSLAPASISRDPNDPSNLILAGSTRWCTVAEIGSAGCPATFADTTAYRIVSAAPQPDGTLRTVQITLNPQSNATTNTYANNFTIRGVAGGTPLTALVTSPTAQAVVVAGNLSGRVYRDDDNDGVFNSTDVGIPNVDVALQGCSAGPDAVLQTTAIPLAGAIVCAGDDLPVDLAPVQTDASGNYAISDVLHGIYRLVETQPAGYTDGQRNIGTLGGTANAVGTVPSVITDILMPRVGTGTGYNFAEVLDTATLVLNKTTRGGLGSFDFTLANVTQTTGTVTTTAVDTATQVDGDDAAAGVQAFLVTTMGTDVTVTEPALVGWQLSAAETQCTIAGTVVGSLDSATGTYTIPGASVVPGTEIVCTYVNETEPGVTVIKTSDPAEGTEVTPGASIGYTVTAIVTNAATTGVVTLTDTLSDGLTLVANSFIPPTGGNCSANGAVITCTLAAGSVAGTYDFHYQATVDADATVAVNNVVVPSGIDNPTCAAAADCTTQHPISAVFTIDKAIVGVPQLVAGSADQFTVRYTVSVANIGGSTGTYSLTDTPQFDTDASIVSATATRGQESPVNLTATTPWTLATDRELAAGMTEVYTLDVLVRVAAGSSQDNDVCVADTPNNGLFNLATLTTASGEQQDNACGETPKPVLTTQLVIEKRGSVREAEMGDLVSYTVRIRNNGPGIALMPVLVDRLPAGFRLVDGTAKVQGATLVSLQGAPGPVLRLTLDRIDPGAEVVVAYRVRIGVGALEGDGINRAQVECPTSPAATTTAPCSNESDWEVDLDAGVFTEEGCVAGQVFVDCNYNSVKDKEELGIPGVRMYFENGTYLISDSEGKYSYCGLRPTTHVLKVDSTTLPTRSRLVTSASQNVGDAGSLFIDLKKGELHRADFIEGSCNNEVIEQVKARKAQGETSSVQTERGQPAVKFESKPVPQSNPTQEGTDSANQLIEKVRHGDNQ